MRDGRLREINYLRVSVTDRCNLRCRYCLPPEGIPLLPHAEILRFEEICKAVRASTLVGIRKVRLTGGEPLVRQGLVRLVAMLREISGIDDLALSTNGVHLASRVRELKEAGLSRVNISLDTLRPERYHWLTRGGDLTDVWRGIDAALAYELHPVKLNTVVIRGFNEDEVTELARLTLRLPLHVRFIELMPFGPAKKWIGSGGFIPLVRVRDRIESRLGPLAEVRKPAGSGPALYRRIGDAPGTVGFISGVTGHICAHCNRLRLTAAGKLRPCLFGGGEFDIKGPLRRGAGVEELSGLVAEAIKSKSERNAAPTVSRLMSRIGG
ncbi:MAG TPA: GTP 3',8-cyclase MoaA [Desulfotomaculum sp.]|nr:GTP 3',8-cyclase MoaA [Desulfotomaculum sp.]